MSSFYFAWVDASESDFSTAHVRKDEQILACEIEHVEGDFAGMKMTVRNPRIGLLAPSRKTWGWFSWDNGHGIEPLFFGRLVGIPTNIQADVVQLDFIARPSDYVAQKAALAGALRVLPYYDPVFLSAEAAADPDTVLEGYSRFWHIDRVSHIVTTSDVLTGEDGLDQFLATDVPHDSVAVTLQQSPLRGVSVNANVGWTQGATGSVLLFDQLRVDSFSGSGLIDDWPQADRSLGGGWSVHPSTDIVEIPYTVRQFYVPPAGAGRFRDISGTIAALADDQFSASHPDDDFNLAEVPVPDDWIFITTFDIVTVLARFHEGIIVPLWKLRGNLRLNYNLNRGRTERLLFTLRANVQPIVTLPGEDELETIDISGNDVGIELESTSGTEIPIGNVARSAYFSTDRGRQSIEYLINKARARLMLRSRAVQISFDCRPERVTTMSLRKNARLFDHRLPGGQAVGKVIAYRFTCDGDSGVLIGNVTMGCPIGYGGTVSEVAGDPTYVNDDYVDADYQVHDNTVSVIGTGDVGFTVPSIVNADGGTIDFTQPLTAAQAVIGAVTITNPAAVQKPALIAAGADLEAVRTALQTVPTSIDFQLIDLTNGPFDNLYSVEVTDLEIATGINLESESV